MEIDPSIYQIWTQVFTSDHQFWELFAKCRLILPTFLKKITKENQELKKNLTQTSPWIKSHDIAGHVISSTNHFPGALERGYRIFKTWQGMTRRESYFDLCWNFDNPRHINWTTYIVAYFYTQVVRYAIVEKNLGNHFF